MHWTQQLPTEAGWYWRRLGGVSRFEDERTPHIVEVRQLSRGLAIGNSTFQGWDTLTKYEWAGPIALPHDKEGDDEGQG